MPTYVNDEIYDDIVVPNHKYGCKCKRIVSSQIAGCIHNCDFHKWKCVCCEYTQRYKSWVYYHYIRHHTVYNGKC